MGGIAIRGTVPARFLTLSFRLAIPAQRKDALIMPENNHPYGKWSREELRNAEMTAGQFLQENCVEIADTMRAKAKFLETLVERLSLSKTSFEDRLDYFARVAEIARLIEEDANGFFELASQPAVARILRTVPHR
jgi:hypothetical protein